MNDGFTIRKTISFSRGPRSAKRIREGRVEPRPDAPGRVPRVSRLAAIAIQTEHLVREGVISDYAEAARLGHVSRARMTQILNFLNLAPDIIEQILFLPRVEHGRDAMTERDMRPICAELNWRKQRALWAELMAERAGIVRPGNRSRCIDDVGPRGGEAKHQRNVPPTS